MLSLKMLDLIKKNSAFYSQAKFQHMSRTVWELNSTSGGVLPHVSHVSGSEQVMAYFA